MGYAVYEDTTARDYGVTRWAGYGVPAICDFRGCRTKIDRGMGYRCEEYTVYRYFDENGAEVSPEEDWDDERDEQEEGCGLHFCDEHSDHARHAGSNPKADVAEWVRHMLTDPSWADWRARNRLTVRRMWRGLTLIDMARVLIGRSGLPTVIERWRDDIDDWRLARLERKERDRG